MAAAAIDLFDNLPRIKGPKLHRFMSGCHEKIEYVKLLGGADKTSSSNGIHGYVFSVRIDSKPYALKVFRFFDLEETRGQLGPFENSRVSDDDILGQTDPFYAECRAYGRIAKRSRKYPIAVACHGFISVPASMESYFVKKFAINDWNRPLNEFSLTPAKRQPFRALVKDLVEADPEFTETLVKSMLRELRALHSSRIYVMDIAWRNYKGGHLVDFSSAWTEPYFEFRKNIRPEWEIRQRKRDDLYEFDEMVQKSGVQTSIKAVREPESERDLRSRKRAGN